MVSCAQKIPQDIKIYQGSNEEAAIVRKQANEAVSCVDPAFNQYFCVSKEGLEQLLLCPVKGGNQ